MPTPSTPTATYRASSSVPRLQLPPPRYAQDPAAIRGWEAAVGLPFVLPPGPASGWTSLLSWFGLGLVQLSTPSYEPVFDQYFLHGLLEMMHAPSNPSDSVESMLVRPVPAASVLVALRALVETDDANRQGRAMVLLGILGDVASVPGIAQHLADPTPELRLSAAGALGQLGGEAAIEALSRPWWDEDSGVNEARLLALHRLGALASSFGRLDKKSKSAPANFVRILQTALEEEDPSDLAELFGPEFAEYRAVLIEVLMDQPGFAAPHADRLMTVLADDTANDQARLRSAEALALVGEDALEPLAELLANESWQQRMFGAIALGNSAALSALARNELLNLLTDADGDVRREAALALCSSGYEGLETRVGLLSGFVPERYAFFFRLRARGALASVEPFGHLLGLRLPDRRALLCLGFGAADAIRGVTAMAMAHTDPELVMPMAERVLDLGTNATVELRRAMAAACFVAATPPKYNATHSRLLLQSLAAESLTFPGDPRARALELVYWIQNDDPLRASAIQAFAALDAASRAYVAPLVRRFQLRLTGQNLDPLLSTSWRPAPVTDFLARTVGPGSLFSLDSCAPALRAKPGLAAALLLRNALNASTTNGAFAALCFPQLPDDELVRVVECLLACAAGMPADSTEAVQSLLALGRVPAGRCPAALKDRIAAQLKGQAEAPDESEGRKYARWALANLGLQPPEVLVAAPAEDASEEEPE